MQTIFEDMHQKHCPLKPEQEYLDAIKISHEFLIAELSAQHRKLVMKIIDTKDIICDEHALESFKTGFTLAWQIMNELNNDITNGRLFRNSEKVDHLSFNAGSKDKKFYVDTLQLEDSEYNLIRFRQRGACLYKCGNERYNLAVHAPEYKLKLFGTAGGR